MEAYDPTTMTLSAMAYLILFGCFWQLQLLQQSFLLLAQLHLDLLIVHSKGVQDLDCPPCRLGLIEGTEAKATRPVCLRVNLTNPVPDSPAILVQLTQERVLRADAATVETTRFRTDLPKTLSGRSFLHTHSAPSYSP